jgi:hypothetical protein
VSTIIVPITTGKTAELFTRKLGGKAEIITISEDETVSVCKRISYPNQDILGKLVRKRLENTVGKDYQRLRREAFDITFLPFCGESWNAISQMLYAFGQGMKVAIEISVTAVEVGKIQPYTKVIAVGGTGEGADTAIVVKTSNQQEAFGKTIENRLLIYEILAMPLEKW